MLLALALLAVAQTTTPKDATAPPADARPVASVEGRGVQIYTCGQDGGSYQWIFVSPEATLFVPLTGENTGTHSAGPTWRWKDGSAITGAVVAKQPSPRPHAISWLLVKTQRSGENAGFLTPVRLVRRSDTEGGEAPAMGCDAEHDGVRLRVPYRATYTFYTLP